MTIYLKDLASNKPHAKVRLGIVSYGLDFVIRAMGQDQAGRPVWLALVKAILPGRKVFSNNCPTTRQPGSTSAAASN